MDNYQTGNSTRYLTSVHTYVRGRWPLIAKYGLWDGESLSWLTVSRQDYALHLLWD